MRFASLTLTRWPAGNVLTQGNCEGTATGFGTVHRAAIFVDCKSGTFSLCTFAYFDNGEELSGTSALEGIVKHRWRLQGFVEVSDGRTVAYEGEIDLNSRSRNGKLREELSVAA